jgi:hypothetical protein
MRGPYGSRSKMTCSVVAVVTDVVRDGRRVVGYGFNSNGRYAQGALMRERFIPRLMAAAPESLLDDDGGNLSPFRAAGLHLGGNESYPEVFKPFGGFADGIAVEDGRVRLPDVPGIGFEAKRDLYAVVKELAA